MIKIYYDEASSNIIIGEKLTGRPDGVMEAVTFNPTKIGIRYKNSDIFEAVLPWNGIEDATGNPIGSTETEALEYLNTELNKSSSSVGGISILERNVALSGTTQTISLSSVQLTKVLSYHVYNTTTKKEVSALVINNGNNLVVDSNQDLTGYTLTIIGV